jgi:hypothetical protein
MASRRACGLGRSFGTLRLPRFGDYETGLAEALAKMYEQVAADCFVPLSITR